MKLKLEKRFHELYHQNSVETYFAPGRVNLIGEHIDYSGGLVMPCAITKGTWLLIAPNNDNVFRFSSINFEETAVLNINQTQEKIQDFWFNYPLGVINYMLGDSKQITGLDLMYFGNIPIGSGLSSSASIEIVTAYALNDFFDLGYDKLDLVKISKWVENEFIGLNSGIMDQFAVAFGQKNKAIVLDCNSLNYKMVDIDLGSYVLAIINTNKSRTLANSKYNERVKECKQALQLLNAEIKLNNLCELSAEKFALHSYLINDKIVLDRATHAVKENDRVHLGAKALNTGNLMEFGRLMYASHDSLKKLYDVSCVELDTIVDFCLSYQHVIGARMTGAGFGGCAIALLKKGHEEDFAKQLTDYYVEKIGYPVTIYLTEIGNGPKKYDINDEY